VRPSFAGAGLRRVRLEHRSSRHDRMHSLDDEGAGVDEDLAQPREVVRAAIEDEQARLRGDGDARLVGDLEPRAADERFLRDEDLDVLLELAAQLARQSTRVRDAPLENLAPLRWKGLRAQPLPAP